MLQEYVFHKVNSKHLIFTYKTEGKISVLLLVLMCTFIYMLYYEFSFYIGLLLLFPTYFLITRRCIIVDFENLQYKNARIFNSYSNGLWKPLPKIEYISIFKATVVSKTYSITYRYIEHKQKIIKINLVYNTNKKLTIFETLEEPESLKLALEISNKINVPILNALSKDRVWLNKKNI